MEFAVGVAAPGGYTVRQLQQLEVRVDLDQLGTVRAISYSLGGSGATIEFVEPGVPTTPIELPPQQTVRIWDLIEDDPG